MTTTVLDLPAVPFEHEPASTTRTQNPIHVLHRSEIERERYEGLLALPTRELRQYAAQEIRAELDLPLDAQREAIHARLAAWLEMDAEDARILARIWDEAAAVLPTEDAHRRFEAERDATLHGFRFQDFVRLAEFMPWMRSRLALTLFGRAAQEAA